MNYKEALFFIGKCLTISHEEHNKKEITEIIKTDSVDWDMIVKVSTTHYVFPALYCNLKRIELLTYLPEDLVGYMKHITDLNRERNEAIISQAKEINNTLLAHKITPIFLKGTGNLLSGLYEDIGERMVGDIDFLVNPNSLSFTIEKLKQNGYKKYCNQNFDNTFISRHYPKMIKEDRIASIEVHYRMVSDQLVSEFNYNFIKNNTIKFNKITTLSYKDKIIMTSINKQFNDRGEKLKNFGLRNSYDLFLLSKKYSPKEAVNQLKNHKYLNNFLASSYTILGAPSSIDFIDNIQSKKYVNQQLKFLTKQKSNRISNYNKQLVLKHRLIVIFKAIYNKQYRLYLINRIKSKF